MEAFRIVSKQRRASHLLTSNLLHRIFKIDKRQGLVKNLLYDDPTHAGAKRS